MEMKFAISISWLLALAHLHCHKLLGESLLAGEVGVAVTPEEFVHHGLDQENQEKS